MYESKYQRYITRNTVRFAEPEEIKETAETAFCGENNRAAGAPLYYEKGKVYVDNQDNHTLVVGPTGCKKSRVTCYSTVASIIEAGESAVINDPKGEIYRRTAKRARKVGADVVLLNFRKPSQSQGWNPMMQALRFHEKGKHEEALQCITDFAESVVAPSMVKTNDTYWGETSRIFLTALMLIIMDSVPKDYFNFKNLIPFCYESNERVLKQIVDRMDQTSTAVFGLRTVIDLTAEKTKSCVYSMLLSVLQPFVQNKALLDMLCDDSVDLEQIGKKQTLIYVVYPDEKNNLNFLVSLLYTQIYETLVSISADMPNDRLPVRVNFVLDEFSNLAKVENFDNRISEARSKNIRYFLFIQSYGQLKEKYKDHAETILSNCNNWICFSSKEMCFLEKLSKICGTEIDSNGREHEFISAVSMQHFRKEKEKSEVLIIKQGQYPFVTALPDFDYINVSSLYEMTGMHGITPFRIQKSMTPKEWIRNVDLKIFKFPYPENPRVA